jgi:hypothetical protein
VRSQAKKISEIHAAAQAELGMVVPGLLPSLAALPALPRGLAPGQAADVELFPAFKGGGARPRRPPCPPLIGPPLPSSAFRAGGARTADLPCVGDGAGKQASSCIVVRQRRHAGADVPRSLPPLSRAVCAPTSEKIVIVGRWAGACAHARLLPHADDSWQAAGKQRSSYFGTPSRRPRPRARLLARADDGWETVGKKRSTSRVDGRQVSSAFLGEYTPVPAGAPPAPRLHALRRRGQAAAVGLAARRRAAAAAPGRDVHRHAAAAGRAGARARARRARRAEVRPLPRSRAGARQLPAALRGC